MISTVIVMVLSMMQPAGPDNGRLVIEVDNIREARGTVWVGIYDSKENYLVKERAIIQAYQVQKAGLARIYIDTLPYGTYAIALFHDINGNGEMDRNFLGIPTEPFAFSRPPRSKWRLPYFGEVAFRFRYNYQYLRFSLKHWQDQ